MVKRVSISSWTRRAAESPGHKLRVNYGTAFNDLQGIDRGLIKRPQRISTALSRALRLSETRARLARSLLSVCDEATR